MEENWEALRFGTYGVSEVAHTTFTLSDGIKLGIKAWLPCSIEKLDFFSSLLDDNTSKWSRTIYPGMTKLSDDATFPSIIEYIPYSKDGLWTLARDYARHPWFASHGYIVLRVDLRGSGMSEGSFYGEYEEKEFDDCVELINWISKQKWSNGAVGMYGKSWGGFNGLQVAYKQPKALKTIISLYSTDDRYNDDFHHEGNIMIGEGMISWANFMYAMNGRPMPPQYFEDVQTWKDVWMDRLVKSSDSFLPSWLEHQHPDDPFWKHGSVCEDYTKIQCPTLVIGGLSDGYLNAATRMAGKLNSKSKFLLGPWTHNWPDVSVCGPNIDFLQLCLSWWDEHLKGKPISQEATLPRFSLFLRDSCLADEIYGEAKGKWVSFPDWQTIYKEFEDAKPGLPLTQHLKGLFLGPSMSVLTEKPSQSDIVELHPHALQGVDSGNWYTTDYGVPRDQKIPNEHSSCWKSEKITEDVTFAGLSKLFVKVSAKTAGKYALQVRICDEFENGKSTLITKGCCNLCYHENGLVGQFSGEETTFLVKLNSAGYTVKPGHCIVISISPTYYPLMYPAINNKGLSINTEDAVFIFQTTSGEEANKSVSFNKPGPLLKIPIEELSKEEYSFTTTEEADNVFKTVCKTTSGLVKFPGVGYECEATTEESYYTDREVSYSNMNSVNTIITNFNLGDQVIATDVTTCLQLQSSECHFAVDEHLKITVDGEIFFETKKKSKIPRKYC